MTRQKGIPGLVALKQIIESTSSYTGIEFFRALVRNLAEILDVHGVWITEFWPNENKLNALAFWLNGKYVSEYIYNVTNTPCEPVLETRELCHIADNVIQLYPNDPDLKPLGAVSYMGLSLRDSEGTVLGHLALLDDKPMPEIPEVLAIFKIFASRASAELQREIIKRRVEESESKLNRLVNGASDAIIELDAQFTITQANEAARHLFGYQENQLFNLTLSKILEPKSFKIMADIIPKHEALSNAHGSLRLNQLMVCLDKRGSTFPVDISISKYAFDQQWYYLLYIRDVTQQLLDQDRIKRLDTETTMLKEQMNAREFSYIIGNSKLIKDCLELIKQVAPTDANVLIQGETGTGKELFARAIHEASTRSTKPIITLNCAALPHDLIESELFGHVKGAFTGAVANREGRFSLADGGTLFLDEIAELPLSLQAKLLRVIQEGSFERLGSSETTHVDVRIIAATHRNLKEMVDGGKFREDLFYRLNVFPLYIPPLRERGEDVILLANAFFEKITRNGGMSVDPISKHHINELLNYHWPGNVRELQNIIERGIITSKDGKFRLDQLSTSSSIDQGSEIHSDKLLSFDEIRNIEKSNIIKALNLTNWKISGDEGAAALLQIPRTTLASKIKKFGIKRVAVG